jgi:hypothetical protein
MDLVGRADNQIELWGSWRTLALTWMLDQYCSGQASPTQLNSTQLAFRVQALADGKEQGGG